MCVCVGGGDRVGGGATVFAEATRINEDTIVSNAALIFLSLSLSLSVPALQRHTLSQKYLC